MLTDHVVQPPAQFGQILEGLLNRAPLPQQVILVSAFGNRQTLMRFRGTIAALKAAGTAIRAVVGIDLQGTSEEALRELLTWGIDARVVNHPIRKHTFHPKIYIVERPSGADVFIGSNNFTEGGFYTNYEAAVHHHYDRPADNRAYNRELAALQRLIDPTSPTTRPLSADLIGELTRRRLVLSQRELQRRRRETREGTADPAAPPLFGSEHIPDPPPLGATLLAELRETAQRERKAKERATRARRSPAGSRRKTGRRAPVRRKSIELDSTVELTPTSFFMELNRLQGPNIPGEARIPLDARDLAEEFWGWQGRYNLLRGSGGREYWQWKPKWIVSDAATPGTTYLDDVRMYEYNASSDFRFYSSHLVALGGDSDDIVKITRLSNGSAEFSCVLAKRGTQVHLQWLSYCTQAARRLGGRRTPRRFGYA